MTLISADCGLLDKKCPGKNKWKLSYDKKLRNKRKKGEVNTLAKNGNG